jgi:hypothetical protein
VAVTPVVAERQQLAVVVTVQVWAPLPPVAVFVQAVVVPPSTVLTAAPSRVIA